MDPNYKLVEIIRKIEDRPKVFLPNYSIYDLDAFICGYMAGRVDNDDETNLSERELWHDFQTRYMPKKLSYREDTDRYYVTMLLDRNRTPWGALDMFFDLWRDFVGECQTPNEASI